MLTENAGPATNHAGRQLVWSHRKGREVEEEGETNGEKVEAGRVGRLRKSCVQELSLRAFLSFSQTSTQGQAKRTQTEAGIERGREGVLDRTEVGEGWDRTDGCESE
ncbi:hypothetical protein R1flu_010353 [Riccia fluitans]|uniref:Uncharacterized protein n=1 Tax=Riccia fluitans TaxID=41844 RepID=A0ABD1Z527_9MARC